MNIESRNIFPRKLSDEEKFFLFSILPVNKPGYLEYRNKINSLVITGVKDYGDFNFFMGSEGTLPDMVSASTPVFALGTFVFTSGTVDVIIHEEISDEIEIEMDGNISLSENQELLRIISYSYWTPGNRSPEKDDDIREIFIKPTPYLLAVSAPEKKIWIHNIKTGVNTLIPVSNYYNSLMLLKNERKPEVVLNPNLFFDNLDSYNNEELVNAFVIYNKYMKRFLL